MALQITIKQEGLIPKISRRQIQDLTRDTLKRIAGQWHYRYSAKHFTAQGARLYRYQPRVTKEIYTGRIKKGRGAKSGLPLVKSGETRRKAKSKTVTGTFRRSRVSMPIGHINRYKPKGFAGGQLRFELTLVKDSEQAELGRDAEKHLRRQFSRRKKNIRISQFSQPAT